MTFVFPSFTMYAASGICYSISLFQISFSRNWVEFHLLPFEKGYGGEVGGKRSLFGIDFATGPASLWFQFGYRSFRLTGQV